MSLSARVTVSPNPHTFTVEYGGKGPMLSWEFPEYPKGYPKGWDIDYELLRRSAGMNRPSWWRAITAGRLSPTLRRVYGDMESLRFKILALPWEDGGRLWSEMYGPPYGGRQKFSSLGHAVRALYLVAVAEEETGRRYRAGDVLKLPYMYVVFFSRNTSLPHSRL